MPIRIAGENMKMFKKNDMGIEFEISIVSTVTQPNGTYVIYTDFTNDSNGELKLYVGKFDEKQNILDVSLEEYDTILKEFRELENNNFGLEKKGD